MSSLLRENLVSRTTAFGKDAASRFVGGTYTLRNGFRTSNKRSLALNQSHSAGSGVTTIAVTGRSPL
jgi:hypothetical protein